MVKTTLSVPKGRQEFVVTAVLDAPKDAVFRLLTDPKLLQRWWGPNGANITVDKMDVRTGGLRRIVMRDSDGKEDVFKGVYHKVSPEQIVLTLEWEGMPGHVLLDTMTFEEKNGQTIVTDQSVFQSVADRDGMVNMDMEKGVRESWERFEKLLVQESVTTEPDVMKMTRPARKGIKI